MGELDPLLLALLALAGVAAGTINTVAGGGSLLTLPMLMALGLPADVANGTNRLCVVTQSVSGVAMFHREGKLPMKAVLPIALPTVVGAAAGALGATLVPRDVLKPVLLVVMVAMALLLAIRPRLVTATEGEAHGLRERPAGIAGLVAAGVYGGFVQAGVGFLLLAVLAGLLRYDLARANALKLVCTLLFGLVALSIFVAAGQMAWVPGAVLAAATVVGSQIGVRVAIKVRPERLRWVLLVCVIATVAAAVLRG